MKRTAKQIMVAGVACCMTVAGAMAVQPGTYYTSSNMWFENPQRIYSTNFMAGEVVSGMTRDQVIAARGYPPSHVTQSYKTDEIWKYWDRRAETRQVIFVNDEVYFGK